MVYLKPPFTRKEHRIHMNTHEYTLRYSSGFEISSVVVLLLIPKNGTEKDTFRTYQLPQFENTRQPLELNSGISSK